MRHVPSSLRTIPPAEAVPAAASRLAGLGFALPFALALALGVGLLGLAPPVAAQAGERATRHVILVTVDGLRPRELFGGADPALLAGPEPAGIESPERLRRRFGGESPRARRAKLLPFFWSTLAPRGVVLGNRELASRVLLRNARRFSFPGYAEALTGREIASVTTNDKKRIPVPTVLEHARERLGLEPREVAVYASWDVFPWIVQGRAGTVFCNAGYQALPGDLDDPVLRRWSRWQLDLRTPWDSVRHDLVTAKLALRHFDLYEPRILYLALGETDDWAHARRYDRVLEAARLFDDTLRRLWSRIESSSIYRGRTSLVLTTDHGRGLGLDDWTDHGEDVPGAGRAWIAVIGPDTPDRGELEDVRDAYLGDVAPTVLALLGLDPHAYHSECGRPVPLALGEAATTDDAAE